MEASTASAQASAADLQAVRLSLQAALAQNYFLLRSADVQQKLLDDTVSAYAKALELTKNRYAAGVAAKADIVQAQTQLKSTEAQAIDIGIQRAQLEHAIALLIGKSPADFSLPGGAGGPDRAADSDRHPVRHSRTPARCGIRGTQDRRCECPDRGGTDRLLSLADARRFHGLSEHNACRSDFRAELLWALGPAALAYTLYDGGTRNAQTEQAVAVYEAAVAAYRQTVSSSFQEVEDDLAALRILDAEAQVREEAVISARESVVLTTNQYREPGSSATSAS